MTIHAIVGDLGNHSSAYYARNLQRFFKTGKGEYGEGDVFIGVRMPDIRLACKKHADLPLHEVQRLFDSPIHEHRMAAAILIANRYKKSQTEADAQSLYDLYVKNLRGGRLNNWDLIDVTVGHVIGRHLLERDRSILYELADSQSLWERRAAIIATSAFIAREQSADALALCELLMNDKEDLIHKATGWMLREVGKRISEDALKGFLDRHAGMMPRTMLRYAIERLDEPTRRHYLGR